MQQQLAGNTRQPRSHKSPKYGITYFKKETTTTTVSHPKEIPINGSILTTMNWEGEHEGRTFFRLVFLLFSFFRFFKTLKFS